MSNVLTFGPSAIIRANINSILDDWSSGKFTRADLAKKWGIASDNLLSYAISNARRAGDPRAMPLKEKNRVREEREVAEADAARSRTTAEEMGIRLGPTLRKIDRDLVMQFGGVPRVNKITISGGDSQWETVTAWCALAESLEEGQGELLMAA